MERAKRMLNGLLFPGGKWPVLTILLVVVSMALAFATLLGETPLAYVFYLVSAYSSVVAVAGLITGITPAVSRFICRRL